MKRVVFITGFLGGGVSVIKKIFGEKFYIINFHYDNSGKKKIEVIAGRLKKFIDKLFLKKAEKIDIIAFSMGGLIASYYCKFIDNKKINMLVTISTPFRGAFLGKMFSGRDAVKQMCPNSSFLKKLNRKKFTRIKQKSFWDRDDFVVSGNSARYGHSRRFNFFFHPFATYWPPLINAIKKELEN